MSATIATDAIDPRELEALLLVTDDALDVLADDERRAVLLRARLRLELQLADQLAA
jgi:hypothetical protein